MPPGNRGRQHWDGRPTKVDLCGGLLIQGRLVLTNQLTQRIVCFVWATTTTGMVADLVCKLCDRDVVRPLWAPLSPSQRQARARPRPCWPQAFRICCAVVAVAVDPEACASPHYPRRGLRCRSVLAGRSGPDARRIRLIDLPR